MVALALQLQDSLTSIAPEWDVLVRRSGAGPFSAPGWFDAWWRAFGRGRPEVLTLREGGELVAVLPLTELHGMRRTLTNEHTPRFEIPAASSAARRALLRHVLRTSGTSIQLAMLTVGSDDAHDLVTTASEEGVRLVPHTVTGPPVLRVARTYAAYARTLAPRRRYELYRHRSRLEQMGTLSFEVERGSDDVEPLLGEGFAIAGSPDARAFYRDVAMWAAAQGSLRVARLLLDGHPVAFQFTIEDRGSAYQLAAGEDPRFGDFGATDVLVADTVKWAVSEGLSTYEFVGASEPFACDWTTARLEQITFHAFPRSASGASSASPNPGASPNSRMSRRRKAS